jgi:alpha-glucoside transport system substrate-binding protein
MKRVVLVAGLVLMTAALAFANGKAEKSTGNTGQIGGSVQLVASWSGNEQDVLQKDILAPFEKDTGIQVNYTGTRDMMAILTTRVSAGNPPDLVAFPNPGQMRQFADQGKLVDLSGILDMATIKKDYAQGWLDRGTVNGKLVGLFTKAAAKGFIWYNVHQKDQNNFAIPQTWDQLISLSKKIAQNTGTAPWSIGLESGQASGWPGTDWIENIFLKMWGPTEYQKWYQGKLAWTSDEVKKAFQAWGQIVANKNMVYGGAQNMLSTNFGDAADPLFQNPPKAYLTFQATFLEGFITDHFKNLKPGKDFNIFRFPSIDPKYAKSLEVSGDALSMFNNNKQSAALIKYLSTAGAQAAWIKTGAISPNTAVPLSKYDDPITKQAAQIMANTDIVVFDASDSMPAQMNSAFWTAILNYVKNPSDLDNILKQLDNVRSQSYGGS